jgi:hypothetical protein
MHHLTMHSRVFRGSNTNEPSPNLFLIVGMNRLRSSTGILGHVSVTWFLRLFVPEFLLLVSFVPHNILKNWHYLASGNLIITKIKEKLIQDNWDNSLYVPVSLSSTLFAIVKSLIFSMPLKCIFLPFHVIVSNIEGIRTNFFTLLCHW